MEVVILLGIMFAFVVIVLAIVFLAICNWRNKPCYWKFGLAFIIIFLVLAPFV